jgi:hypothetical protein
MSEPEPFDPSANSLTQVGGRRRRRSSRRRTGKRRSGKMRKSMGMKRRKSRRSRR